MATRFYNTLAHETQKFTPLSPGPDAQEPLRGATIKLYTCGPTVYDYAHIGNFRAFLFADVLRRYLEFRGATVHQVMNMTDVGHMTDDAVADATGRDKMEIAGEKLKEAKKSGKVDAGVLANPDDPAQVAQFFVDRFLEDSRALRLSVVMERDESPEANQDKLMPRPTRFIQPFIDMIQILIGNGHAYVGADGVVYYNVSSFPAYGKLSGNSIEQLSHGAGGRTAEHAAKKHPADFFLWKPDPTHLMRWPSPWGEGYPGWHIECSAMATALLGPSIDIHTGGEDNIFPHHECEIAQSEAATGKPFARFWMHTRHLMVNGTKMSKSKGNFFTIRDLMKKGYDPLAIRFALINTRYRESMDFSLMGLHEAASAVTKLRDLAEKLSLTIASIDEAAGENESAAPLEAADQRMLDEFTRAMDDDLNISGALAAVFLWEAPLSKQKKIPFPQARSALAALKKIDHILAVIFASPQPLDIETTAQIEALMTLRDQARTAKEWARSDELRTQLAALNVEVKDSPAGTSWRPRLAPANVPA